VTKRRNERDRDDVSHLNPQLNWLLDVPSGIG
jgi:hypothetical protein